jgi:hypothetical protein
VLVAVLGTTVGYDDAHSAFIVAWWVIAAVGVGAAATSIGMNSQNPLTVEVPA